MSFPATDAAPLRTEDLHAYLDRMRAGDSTARDELLRRAWNRLTRLARRLFDDFPRVRCWVQTDDVLQNALLRLLRTLDKVRPASVTHFYRLAAREIRHELIDLARHFYGPEGQGTHHTYAGPDGDLTVEGHEPAEQPELPEDLEKWNRFHEAVERLTTQEREVVGLLFYHGWTQGQVATLLGIHVRTVRRQWEAALVKLRAAVHEASL